MLNVILLGLVSFFADISSEMVYPIIPLYLTAVFGCAPALVGIVEGIAESVASLLKVFSGYASDRFGRKKPLAFVGYATGALYKLALLFAGSWAGILLARVTDRIGKGLRTAPRDVMVSESAPKSRMGAAFGVHKALDMAGSAIGILLAYLLMRAAGNAIAYKTIFAFSIIPVAVALTVLLFVKEKKAERAKQQRQPLFKSVKLLNSNLKLYIVIALAFTLGNSSNAFLLLRAGEVGFSSANVVLLYLLYNVVASLLSVPLGRVSDRIGRKSVLACGYFVFAVCYLMFGFVKSSAGIIAAFALYGVYTALTAGVERAFIAEIAPPQLKGTMLGLHSTVVGIALLPASVIAGLLWTGIGSAAPFALGALLSLTSAALLLVFFKKTKNETIE